MTTKEFAAEMLAYLNAFGQVNHFTEWMKERGFSETEVEDGFNDIENDDEL